jgi:hypothetical protein
MVDGVTKVESQRRDHMVRQEVKAAGAKLTLL